MTRLTLALRALSLSCIPLFATACGSSGGAADGGSDAGDAAPRADAPSGDTGKTDAGHPHDAAMDSGGETHDGSPGADAGTDAGAHDSGADTGHDGGLEAGVDAGVDGGAPLAPTFDGPVSALVHAGSSWIVGGAFNRANAVAAPNVLALDVSGSPATACQLGAGFDGRVLAVVQSGTSLYVGGDFQHYGSAPANKVAKIDATTCALDAAFAGGASGGFDQEVSALAVSSDSLLVGGIFTSYDGVAGSASQIAKLDLTTGALDTTFSPPGAGNNGFSQAVSSLAVNGSSLYVGGELASYRGQAVGAFVKLNLADGSLDATFPASTVTGGRTFAIAFAGSSVYVGGVFNTYTGSAAAPARIAKLDQTTGALDTTFSPPGANGFSDVVWSLSVSGTSLYVGGSFTAYRGAAGSAEHVAKLDLTTGALDTTFTPSQSGLDGVVNALAVSGTSLVVGGEFTSYRGVANSANDIAKLDLATGAQDLTFKAPGANNVNGFDGYVTSLLVTGNTVVVGGSLASYGGVVVNNIAKFDDTTFALQPSFFGSDPVTNGFDNGVDAMAATATSLYVGGDFTAYQGIAGSASHLAKLDLATGAIETSFSPAGATANGFDGSVDALATSATSLYVGGSFHAYRGVASSANELAKLDLTTGALDATFGPPGATANGFDNSVAALAIAGSSLYVGGNFTAYEGVTQSANYLAKLALDTGVLDTTFSRSGAGANGFDKPSASLAVAGSALYVGGEFTAYRGTPSSASGLAKVDLTSGDMDTTFSPPGAGANGVDGYVLALAVSGTSLYAGGGFDAYRGVPASANDLAKLDLTTGAIDTTFSPPGADSNGFQGGSLFGTAVLALATQGSSVFAGGYFATYRGSFPATNLVYLSQTGAIE